MNLGVIIGYFYGKGLILCPNNKLRYFDVSEEDKEQFKKMAHYNGDRNGNVFVRDYIAKCSIASYSIDKKDKYKVVLEKEYGLEDELKGSFSKELSYVLKDSHKKIDSFDVKFILEEVTKYVQSIDIESILATYKIEEYKSVNPGKGRDGTTEYGIRYTIQTDDTYIKSILPLHSKSNVVYFVSGRVEDSYSKRLFDEEKINIAIFKSKYSTADHIIFLASNKINNDIKSYIEKEKEYISIIRSLSANYPVEIIGYIINKKWPHMSPRMLCIKYNNVFDGTNFDIFGYKDSAKKRFLEKKNRIAYSNWLNYRKDRLFNTCDSENEVMRALRNGCGDYFGY